MSSNELTNFQTQISQLNRNLTPNYYSDEDRFKIEKERLKTFENWPLKWLDSNALAATGMFYTGDGDRTICYFCAIIIGKWEQGDDPVQEHLRWSPNCKLLKRKLTSNVPINESTLYQLLPPAISSYDTPPIPAWKARPITDFSIKAVRLQTFADWPRCMKQKPEQLAEAGFYYKGVGDSVICFSCLGVLKDWVLDDDPWEQHAQWMGHYCPYVKLIKGEEFIKNVALKFKNSPPKILAESGELNQSIGKTTSTEADDDKLCKICFDCECNTAYVPCGHVVACAECALATKDCPLCRVSIERIVRIYFS